MFWNKNKIDKKMIPNLNPTSKASLKQMCLFSANGDIEKAEKLYDYMIKDMQDLPLFDEIPLTRTQQIKNTVADTWNWVNENQEQIMNWVGIIKTMLGKGGGTSPMPPSAPIPPIN